MGDEGAVEEGWLWLLNYWRWGLGERSRGEVKGEAGVVRGRHISA